VKRLSLVGRVALLASVVALVVGVIVASALVAIISLRQSESRESQATAVTVATLRVQELATEVQSSLRGYVLSLSPRFLTTLRERRAQLPGAISQLDRLVADDPIQRGRAEIAAFQITGYLRDYVDNILFIAKAAPSDARSSASGDEDRYRTQQIRNTLGLILATENTRSLHRAVHTRAVARTAEIIGIVGLAGSALLVLLFGACRRGRRPRQRVQLDDEVARGQPPRAAAPERAPARERAAQARPDQHGLARAPHASVRGSRIHLTSPRA